jgi:hypothetical protein
MGKSEKVPERKRGCFGRLVAFVVFLGLVGLGAAVFFILKAQDLSDLDGRRATGEAAKARDLPQVMKNAIDGGYPLTLTEEEINLYLRKTLKAKQGGLLAEKVSLRDVAVRLEDGRAEVIIERDVSGWPVTLSMYLRVEQLELPDGRVKTQIYREGGLYHERLPWPPVGGRFGRLPVPQGFLVLVLPSFESLASVYRLTEEERKTDQPLKALDFINEMARIRIEEGKLVLAPVPGGGLPPLPGGSR